MWFYLSLYFAFWYAISNIFVKKVTQTLHPFHFAAITVFCSVLFMIPLLFMSGGFPHTTPLLYVFMVASAILDTIAFASAYQALKTSQISLITPLASFSPVFTVILAFIFLGESIAPIKISAIVLVLIGLYIVNISEIKKGILTPFKNLVLNRGAQLFFLANFLWAITPILQKAAILQMTPSRPLFASFVGYSFVVVFMIILCFLTKKTKVNMRSVRKNSKILVGYGFFESTAQLAAYTAFSLAPVGYVLSIFRLSTLVTVVLGGTFFKEKNLIYHFLGACLMVAGAVILVL